MKCEIIWKVGRYFFDAVTKSIFVSFFRFIFCSVLLLLLGVRVFFSWLLCRFVFGNVEWWYAVWFHYVQFSSVEM